MRQRTRLPPLRVPAVQAHLCAHGGGKSGGGIGPGRKTGAMAKANFAHQTIWTRDNLEVMRGINSESVDLVYLDPPFNSGKQWSAPVGSEAAGASFKDAWTLSDVDLAWHGEIAEEHPALYGVLDAAGVAHGKAMKSYLIYMAVRLIEIRRLLTPTGSVYLHCDDTAGAYLKVAMDAIFGRAQYRNEITWKRTSGRSDAQRYARVSDRILYYAGGGGNRRGMARGRRLTRSTSPASFPARMRAAATKHRA